MKNRMIGIVWLAAFFLLLLAGSIKTADLQTNPRAVRAEEFAGKGELQEMAEDAAQRARRQAVQTDWTTEYDSGAYSAVTQILARGSRDFFCGYPVDESFLFWIGGTYGQELLVDLAEQITEDTDTGLWYESTGSTMHVLWTLYCRAHGYASWLWQDVMWKDAADPSCIRLDFVGDICLDDTWHTMKAAGDSGVEACISQDVRDELQSADVVVVNNEFAYTKSGDALADKAYTFRAQPKNVRLLSVFGADIVSLANNHVFDFGEQGLIDTLDTLEDAGVAYTGAGRDIREASAVRYVVVGGRKIAIVSATEIERFSHFTRMAGEHVPGVLKTQQEEYVLAAIAEAKANSDYVIMYVHWGAEGRNHYDEGQKELAQVYADAGADAIIGGHPHRLQGVTYIGQAPVVYSLGNFWFSTGSLYTTIAQLQIDGDGELSLVMLPCVQRGMMTSMLDRAADKKEFYHYLADISTGVGMDTSGRVYPYRDVDGPGQSPYAYTSGRKYGMHMDDTDLDGRAIDIVGNLQ